MDERYAAEYGSLARRHWWWQVRDASVLRAVGRHMENAGQARILDIGCGDGRLFDRLSRYGTVEGIEPDGLHDASHPDHGIIHRAQFVAPLPVAGPYELVLMLDVLEHLDRPVEALCLVRELLGRRGVFILTVPAYRALWTSHDDINYHRTRYSPRELISQLVAAGMQAIEMRHLFHALILPKLFVRASESVNRNRYGTVPTVPAPLINDALRRAFDLEARLPESIARWLPGSSIMVVAVPTDSGAGPARARHP